jgi:hypothetical protein
MSRAKFSNKPPRRKLASKSNARFLGHTWPLRQVPDEMEGEGADEVPEAAKDLKKAGTLPN